VWVPFVGWRNVGPDDRERVDRLFQKPMMILALLALPVFAHEFILPESALEVPVVTLAIEIALLFIWLAFTIEFVVKISIAESRPRYALKNWLDVFIILLPFLRPLRGLAMARSLRLARFIGVFGVRGAAMKLLRTGVAAVIGWEFLRRWTRSADTVAADEQRERERLESLSRRELIDEALALKAEVRRLEAALMTGRAAEPSGGDDAPKPSTLRP